MTNIVAIDPGSKGSICLLLGDDVVLIPLNGVSQSDLKPLLERAFAESGIPEIVVIEQPPYFMGPKIPGASLAKLFESVGYIKGFVDKAGFRYHTVIPQVWQEPLRDLLGAKRGKMKHNAWKKILTAHAKAVAKGVKITNQNADSYLLARWWIQTGSKQQ